MPRARSKAYKAGDKFTVQIPSDADPLLLKWINKQKFISPAVVELMENKAETAKTQSHKISETEGDE